MVAQSRNSYVEATLQAPTFDELFKQLEDENGTHDNHVEGRLENLLKEAREKSKSWVSCSSSDNTELYYKKVPPQLFGVAVDRTITAHHVSSTAFRWVTGTR